MKIDVHLEGSIPVLSLQGRFDGFGANEFDQTVERQVKESPHAILDLSGVSYLSSNGIRSLLRLEKKLRAQQGGLLLLGVNPGVAEILDTSGLLGQLRVLANLTAALAAVQQTTTSLNQSSQHTIEGREYSVWPHPDGRSLLDLWNTFSPLTPDCLAPEKLTPVSLKDLELALGIAGLGNNRSQAAEALGEFLSTGNLVGVIPADGHCQSDFLLSDNPSETIVHVAAALGLSGKPFGLVQASGDRPVSLGGLLDDLQQLYKLIGQSPPPLQGLLILAPTPEFVGAAYQDKADLVHPDKLDHPVPGAKGALIIGLAVQEQALRESVDPVVRQFLDQIQAYPIAPGWFFHGHALTLSSLPTLKNHPDPAEMLHAVANLEAPQSVAHVAAQTLLTNPLVWVYLPQTIRLGIEKRLSVTVENGAPLSDETEILMRRLYADAQRIRLAPLHGGFASKTYLVTSYDRQGRRLLPTVTKIGSQDLTNREVEAHKRHVQDFILNNSTTIMGTASFRDQAALRYNFLGITGPDCQLSWLEKRYQQLAPEAFLRLLDKTFTDVLKPWYGQPKWERLRLYEEHDPQGMFPSILADAQAELGLNADDPILPCPELECDLPNPFHFLKHEFPRRKDRIRPWYTSVIHGDLNMKNILVDERDNIYVIDFSETRIGNIVSDFARLEPILKLEFTRVETTEDFRYLLEFEAGLAEAQSLQEPPPLRYRGSDPMVARAHQVIVRLRHYADQVTVFETDVIPYLLALLEWTYPVVSYQGFPPQRKRLAAYSAALICRQLLRLEKTRTGPGA